MGQRTCERGRMAVAAGRALLAGSAALSVAAMASSAHAKEIKLPADHPSIVFEVPDDWVIEPVGTRLKLTSPQKNAIVVARVIDQQKAAAEAFAKESAEDLKAFGVTFAVNPKVPARTTPPPKPKPKTDAAANALQSKADSFTFSGAPSLALPGTAKSNDPLPRPDNSVESLTGFGATVTGDQKLPLRAAQYFGTTLNGQPVDVQLILYRLPDAHYLAMMQESGADDGRTVAMAQSVKVAK